MKIFIISGKAKSGKNEVAKIIKEYYQKYEQKTVITAYSKYLKIFAHEILNWDYKENDKPRTFLQNIGMDIRNKYGYDFLINRMMEDINIYQDYVQNIVISDARLPIEIEQIKDNYDQVCTIHVIGAENKLTKEQQDHYTEHALDEYNKFDYVIDNNDNIESLKIKVEQILNEVDKNEY